jgi:hypothetical protein
LAWSTGQSTGALIEKAWGNLDLHYVLVVGRCVAAWHTIDDSVIYRPAYQTTYAKL